MKHGNSPRIGNRITFRYGDGTVANGGAAATGAGSFHVVGPFFVEGNSQEH